MKKKILDCLECQGSRVDSEDPECACGGCEGSGIRECVVCLAPATELCADDPVCGSDCGNWLREETSKETGT